MALTFAALLSAVLAERRSAAAGVAALPALATAAAGSVAWWQAGEAAGAGNLRAYLVVQGLTGGRILSSSLPACPLGCLANHDIWATPHPFAPFPLGCLLATAFAPPRSPLCPPPILPRPAAAGVGYLALAYRRSSPPPPRASSTGPLLRTLALYAAAVAGDRLDRLVHCATATLMSGHTLKHLLAGAAGWQLAELLRWNDGGERSD